MHEDDGATPKTRIKALMKDGSWAATISLPHPASTGDACAGFPSSVLVKGQYDRSPSTQTVASAKNAQMSAACHALSSLAQCWHICRRIDDGGGADVGKTI